MDLPPRLRYLANCSLLFTEHPLLERPAAAKAAGFDAIEFWWPFDRAVPADSDVDAFVAAVAGSGVALVGLNFFAGDLAGPDAGLVSIPARSAEFRDSVAVAAAIGERLGVRGLNALYGNRVDEATAAEQDTLAVENLAFAADAVAGFGATVLVEAVSGPKPYPLRTAADVAAVLARVRATGTRNVAFLCDLYHLAANGDDIATAVELHFADIAHVQIADLPGRGEPGSGSLDLAGPLSTLADKGYDGWVAAEYRPTSTDTAAGLGWLTR
jgi:hydroxypyruvate isomerase